MTEPSLPEKVVAIDGGLQRARIPHAFGGALALAYYAEPRTTVDIDVNVFIPPARQEAVRAALGPLGVEDRRRDAAAIERDGQARWWWGRTPVDLFFSNDPIHDDMADAVRKVSFGEDRIPILSPEHLVICKALFDRPKDWLDIEQVLAVTESLDHDEIARWLTQATAANDPRVERFETLARRSPPDG